MLQVQYAAANSKGVLASLIGWIDFGTLISLTQHSPTASVTNAIAGGYFISFDISLNLQGNPSATSQVKFEGSTVPAMPSSPFASTAYTGIPGHVALYMTTSPPSSDEINISLILRNICVTDAYGSPVDNYFIVAADSGITRQFSNSPAEIWSMSTDGSPWELVEEMPAINGFPSGSPVVSGLGTRTVTETGTPSTPDSTSANAFLTQSPSELIARTILDGSRQGFAFGIIIPEPKDCYMLSAIRSSHINYVNPPHGRVAALPLKPHEKLISVIYNGNSFAIDDAPVLITGQLGTYLFFETYVLFSGICGPLRTNFDIFSLSIQKCNDCVLRFIVFACKPSHRR